MRGLPATAGAPGAATPGRGTSSTANKHYMRNNTLAEETLAFRRQQPETVQSYCQQPSTRQEQVPLTGCARSQWVAGQQWRHAQSLCAAGHPQAGWCPQHSRLHHLAGLPSAGGSCGHSAAQQGTAHHLTAHGRLLWLHCLKAMPAQCGVLASGCYQGFPVIPASSYFAVSHAFLYAHMDSALLQLLPQTQLNSCYSYYHKCWRRTFPLIHPP